MAGHHCPSENAELSISRLRHRERRDPAATWGGNLCQNKAPTDSPRLCRILHDRRNLSHHDPRARVLAIDLPVRLSRLARLGDEDAEVGAHARVDHADVGADQRDL